MLRRVFVFGAVLTLAAACTRKPQSGTDANGPQDVVSSAEGGGSDASTAGLLGELTQAVRKFSAEQRRVPKNLDELVAQGYLNQVPPAPAGQSFAINKNLQVYLTSR